MRSTARGNPKSPYFFGAAAALKKIHDLLTHERARRGTPILRIASSGSGSTIMRSA
jgi:NAD(P)H-dependent FMN reductase